MKRTFPWLLAALALAGILARADTGGGVLLDSYAAVVNGKVITVGDVLSVLQPAQERLAARYTGAELEQKVQEEYEQVRDRLVESELILVAFEMQGGTLPDRAIEDHVNSVIHDRFNNDRSAFLEALAKERLTFAEWRKQMKDQLIVQIMRQREVTAKIVIAPYDLQQAYDRRRDDFARPERVRLRTLALPAATKPAGAVKLRDLFQAGKYTFEQAAAKGATLQDDGELIETGSLNPAIRDAIAGLAPGGISAPVEVAGTVYLVELAAREPAGMQPLEEVAPDLEQELRRAEFERLNKIWIDSLRAKYYVQVFTHDLFE